MFKYAKAFLSLIIFLFIFCNAAVAEEMLSWRDCIKEAAINHPDLIAAQEEVKQSESAKKITASALFPQVDASLNASTARNASDQAPATTADSYSYGVSGTQLIFDAGKTINNVRAASKTQSRSPPK